MEKSRGAVLYTKCNEEIKYVLVINVENKECGIPKGHIEANETDYETVLREIKEETMIDATIVEGFSNEVSYTMPNGITKQVIYYIATFDNQIPKHNPDEKLDVLLLDYDNAMEKLTYENVKEVLKQANKWILKNVKGAY